MSRDYDHGDGSPRYYEEPRRHNEKFIGIDNGFSSFEDAKEYVLKFGGSFTKRYDSDGIQDGYHLIKDCNCGLCRKKHSDVLNTHYEALKAKEFEYNIFKLIFDTSIMNEPKFTTEFTHPLYDKICELESFFNGQCFEWPSAGITTVDGYQDLEQYFTECRNTIYHYVQVMANNGNDENYINPPRVIPDFDDSIPY